MAIEILDCVSRCLEDTNFFNDQKKLDTVYYLMQGLTYREIAEKIDKHISYVQRVNDYLRSNGLLYWGRWAPNVYRIGMKKSVTFLNWKDRKVPQKDNSNYVTYIHHMKAGKTKVFVVYTYPEEDEKKIKDDRGEEVTSFYYTHTRFTVPLFKKINLVKEFFDRFDSVKNDEKILTGTPSFETETAYRDPTTVYICKYAEMLPELTPGILTDKLEVDFKDYDIDINYERVRTTLNRMKEEEVIYPKNALYLKPLSFQSTLVKIRTKEIYRIMSTFNQFNMFTNVAMTRDSEVSYLFIQYPFHQFSEVMEILDDLDPTHTAYVATKFVMGYTIPYDWSLKTSSKSEPKN